MYTPLEFFIGLRYVRARRRDGFISIISLFSIVGLALGVATLIIVLSVMNGFERELKKRILGMISHATITEYDRGLRDWPKVAAAAKQHPQVVGVAPYVERQAMLLNGSYVRGALIRGIEPRLEREVSEIDKYMNGEYPGGMDALQPGRFGVILGASLARFLGVVPGSKVNLVAPQASFTPAGVMPRMRQLTVVGVFQADHSQFDALLALMHIEDSRKLFRMGERVSGVRLKVDDLFEAERIAAEVANSLDGGYWPVDWAQQHRNFFEALKLERTMMFIILTVVVAVAAFNIVSTLVMVVTEKRSDIAILRTIGASPTKIMRIFVVQGTFIGLIGTAFGVGLGLLISLNLEAIVPALEKIVGGKILPPAIYWISDVPSEVSWYWVTLITTIAFSLAILSTLYPAWRAARINPAEALRYE